jgi:putative endonuclease
MAWFLYLLECSDGSIYTGIATDVQARFEKHTRSRKPVRVLASFELMGRSDASRAEYWVKRLTPGDKRALAAGLRTLESVMPVVEVETEAETEAETEVEVATPSSDTATVREKIRAP